MVDRTFHDRALKSSPWLSAPQAVEASDTTARPPVVVAPEVESALAAGRPVVALETTIICHGIPAPDNAELAAEIDAAVRAEGAVPASIAVSNGALRIGLALDQLLDLARQQGVRKCTTRDLPDAIAGGGAGATTVAATLFAAAMAGIPVMATGGIGGVHRGGATSLDVSADLDELSRRSVIVVAAGIKTILDVRRTIERLETLGVPLVGYRTDQMPGFYTRSTGIGVGRLEQPDEIVARFGIQRRLGLPAALLVLQPPPADLAIDPDEMERLIGHALEEARAAGVAGPDETPFLLRSIARASAGATVRLNRALAVGNAQLGAKIAVATCRTG